MTPETGQEPARTSTPTSLLVVCAALGLGAYATAHLFVLDRLAYLATDAEDASEYTWFGVLVLALLVWHLSPRWSWPVLLVLGAVCALPIHLRLLSDGLEPWMRIPYVVVDAASRPLLLVGLLGVATAVGRAGHRAIGAALLGAPLIVPPLMTFVVATFANDEAVDDAEFLPVIGLVLAVATIFATAAAVATRLVSPVPRPGWAVTTGGVVAGAAPVVFLLWRGPERVAGAGDAAAIDAYYNALGQHLLIVGPVVLGIGLLAGALAGPRVLAAGAAAGLLVGAAATLLTPAVAIVNDLSTGVAALLALAVLAAGLALALSRARMAVGVAGLGVAAVWVSALWLVSRPEDGPFDEITAGLVLVLVLVAAVPVLASLSTVVAPVVPAAFAGVAAAVSLGVIGIGNYLMLTSDDEDAQRFATYLPAIVLLVAAAGLTVLVHRRWGRTEAPRVDLEPVTVA